MAAAIAGGVRGRDASTVLLRWRHLELESLDFGDEVFEEGIAVFG